jgi:hypothetical protein
MYKSSVENNWEQVLGHNNSVMVGIEQLANKTDSDISQLSDVSDREITRDRMLVCAIYNEKTDKVFVLKSSFRMNSKAEYYPSMNSLKNSGLIEDSQERVLSHILNVAKKWASSIPEYYTAREDATALSDEPGKYKAWDKYESELMTLINQKNVKDDLGSAEVADFSKMSDEQHQKIRDRIKQLLAQQDQDSEDDLGPAENAMDVINSMSQEERDAYFKSGRDLIAKLLAQQDQNNQPRDKKL